MTTISDKISGKFLAMEFKEDSVVIACLRNSLSGMSLLSSSSFPSGDNEASLDQIREHIGRHCAGARRVFVSVPDKWAIIKFTSVPSMKGKGGGALEGMMKFEIERHIPFQMEDVASDFLALEEKDNTASMVIVAVRREKIEFLKDFLGKLSLRPDAVLPASFAVLNAAEFSGVTAGGWREITGLTKRSNVPGKKNEANAFIYIDGTKASLSVIKDGLCVQMRLFDAGQTTGTFVEDIVRYLTEMQHRFSVERYNRLIVTGDASAAEKLRNELIEKAETGDVNAGEVTGFSGYIRGVEMKGLAPAVGAAYAGIGIGTYRINMLPHKISMAAGKKMPLTTKLFLVLIIVLAAGILATDVVKQKRAMTRIDEALGANAPAINEIEKMSSGINSLRQRRDHLRNIKENEVTLELLAEISALLPRDAWITNLDYKRDITKAGGELTMNGLAASSSGLIPLLEDSAYLDKVEFVGPIKKSGDREQFKISARVVPLKKEKEINKEKNIVKTDKENGPS